MKKLLTVISVVCLGVFGFSAQVIADVEVVECDNSTLACNDNDDLYSVKLNCDNLTGAISGNLTFTSGDPATFVVSIADANGAICNIEGDIDSPKTDGKCTNQSKGPNKQTGNGHGQNQNHDTSGVQVDYEIELEEVDSDYCKM